MKPLNIIFPQNNEFTPQQIRENRKLRLGELLVAEKILTPDQINDAIEAQQLYGSRFGTSLVELGYIDESSIAKILSSKLNLPYIESDSLMLVPQDIIALVPAGLAQKHLVIPCDCIGKKLYLAMADPLDLAAIDDLRFRLGYIIIPVVIPEFRLKIALSKFYQMRLSPRLKTLDQHLLDKKSRRTNSVASPWSDTQGQSPSSPTRASQKGLEEAEDAVTLLDEDECAPLEPARKPTSVSRKQQTSPSPEKITVATDISQQLPFADVCQLLADAKDRESIAQTLLAYLGQTFHCGAALTVKGNLASGWHAALAGRPLFNFNHLTIDLTQQSLIRQVVEDKHYYLGPPTSTEQDIRLLSCFTTKTPETVLFVPLIIQGRLIGILYIQDSREQLEKKLAEVHQISTKTSMAFEILILRGKILIA